MGMEIKLLQYGFELYLLGWKFKTSEQKKKKNKK